LSRRTLILFISFFLFFGASPITNVLPIKTLFILLFFFTIIFFLKPVINKNLFVFSLFYLFTISIICLYHNSLIPFFYGAPYFLVLYLALELYLLDINYFVDKLSILFTILLILAIISFVYFTLGGPPIFSLKNADGRYAFFYLTSFNNGSETIRPTGIFDEPGAFSFFVCLLVIYRDILNKSKDQSLLILILGFVTQSLTHIIFFSIYLLNYLALITDFKFKSIFKFVIMFSFLISITFIVMRSSFSEYTQNRTEKYINDPNSTGRILSLSMIYDELTNDYSKIIFGLNKSTAERDKVYLEENDYGENILTPIVYGGLLASWPFFLFILYLLYYFIFNQRIFSLIGGIILLVQRPYFLELPYSFPLAVLCIMLVNYDKSKVLE
jgi:hypothetical protein